MGKDKEDCAAPGCPDEKGRGLYCKRHRVRLGNINFKRRKKGQLELDTLPADDLTITGTRPALDSQTYLIEPGRYEDIKTESQEAVTGEVGLELEDRMGVLVVSDVKLGMPADGAGIRLGDRLVRVDDAPAAGLSVARAGELLRGPIGSSVALTVEREGAVAPLSFTMARQAQELTTEAMPTPAAVRGNGHVLTAREIAIGELDKMIAALTSTRAIMASIPAEC